MGFRRLVPVLCAASFMATVAGVAAGGCGARSELRVGGRGSEPPPSDTFCAESGYHSGFSDISLYLLLDKSGSMSLDGKWTQATAALSAFVDDPSMADVSVALQFFPLGWSCDAATYAYPAVPFAPLPGNAAAIKNALAEQKPDGETPTLPVLRAALEHAKGMLLGDPSRAVAVALLTDGAPNACESSTEKVAGAASQGASEAPKVLTYVIGLETGYLNDLAVIAEAGGTGSPILVGADGAAQQLVDALKSLRDNLEKCRFAVPPVPDVEPKASDVTVSVRLTPDANPNELPRVAGPASCSGLGYYVDDELAPTFVELCPASCAAVHGSQTSRVIVRAGCGAGSGPIDGGVDGGDCGGVVTFTCLSSCGASPGFPPDCVAGIWQCPPGTVASYQCQECPVQPHGCCGAGGALSMASCVDGNWICPPGSVIFGSPGCTPPDVCAGLMPCPSDMFCEVTDLSCGEATLLGSCLPRPSDCPPDGAPACGCNGVTYDSSCDAAAVGIHVSAAKSCEPPATSFRCGPLFCQIHNQVCRETRDLLGEQPTRFDCLAKPGGCSTGCGCDLCESCPPGKQCGETCSQDVTGGAVLLCTQL